MGISTSNKAFATTTSLSITSAQHQLFVYLSLNHLKVAPKILALREDPAVDAQLTTAAASSNYNIVFHDVMQKQLTTYQAILKKAYTEVKGTQGRKLINQDFEAAKLLEQQLASSSS